MRIYIYYIERNLIYFSSVNFNFYIEYYYNNYPCELVPSKAEMD